jgi:hypothetical protein
LTAPGPGAGTATGNVTNAAALSVEPAGKFAQAFGIQVRGATTSVGSLIIAPPNGDVLAGNISNTGGGWHHNPDLVSPLAVATIIAC